MGAGLQETPRKVSRHSWRLTRCSYPRKGTPGAKAEPQELVLSFNGANVTANNH